jgi:uncharacterized protein (DUF488 family)
MQVSMRKRAEKPKTTTAERQMPVVFTIGHSTRTIDDFIQLLKDHGVLAVADVRTIPRSRYNPQFNSGTLSKSLQKANIAYAHLAGLGGLRHSSGTSINNGWRNASFRGFADYMQTQEFEKALKEFMGLARERPSALMCAEAVPWRCHRSLISDALLVRGIAVEHIRTPTSRQPHKLTPFAKVQGSKLIYPGDASSQMSLSV